MFIDNSLSKTEVIESMEILLEILVCNKFEVQGMVNDSDCVAKTGLWGLWISLISTKLHKNELTSSESDRSDINNCIWFSLETFPSVVSKKKNDCTHVQN